MVQEAEKKKEEGSEGLNGRVAGNPRGRMDMVQGDQRAEQKGRRGSE